MRGTDACMRGTRMKQASRSFLARVQFTKLSCSWPKSFHSATSEAWSLLVESESVIAGPHPSFRCSTMLCFLVFFPLKPLTVDNGHTQLSGNFPVSTDAIYLAWTSKHIPFSLLTLRDLIQSNRLLILLPWWCLIWDTFVDKILRKIPCQCHYVPFCGERFDRIFVLHHSPAVRENRR